LIVEIKCKESRLGLSLPMLEGVSHYERGEKSNCVTESGDQRWSVAIMWLKAKIRDDLLLKLSCAKLRSPKWESSEMPRALELLGWKRPLGEERLLEWLWSNGGFWLLGHMSSSCVSQILTTKLVI